MTPCSHRHGATPTPPPVVTTPLAPVHGMDSKKVEYHFHGNVIINGYNEYNRTSFDTRGSIIQDAYNTNIRSTGALPMDPDALPRNRRTQDDEQEEEELGDISSHSSTAQAPQQNNFARPPATSFNTRPAISEPRGPPRAGVSPEFRSTHLTPAHMRWLDGDLPVNDEPVPLAPSPPIEGMDFTPQGQDGAQNAIEWDMEIEHHEIRARRFNLASGRVSIRNRALEREQWEISQTPGFPVSSTSPPPISTYTSYGGNVTSHPAYPAPVPSYADWHTTSHPPFPTAEVADLDYAGLPAPTTAYGFHRMPSPSIPALNTIAHLNSTPSTFTSDLYGGPNRSATFAGTSWSPAPGFPAPQFHPRHRHP